MSETKRVQFQDASICELVTRSLTRTGLYWKLPRQLQLLADAAGVLYLICCISIGLNFMSSLEDHQALIDAFTVFSFLAVGFYKYITLKNNTHIIWKMMKDATNLERTLFREVEEFEYESYKDEDLTSEYTKKYNKNMRSVGRGLSIVYWSTLVVFAITPFVEYSWMLYTNSPPELPHILPTWTPFGNSFIIYILIVTFEFVTSTYCVSVHVAFDIFSISFMILISGQLSLLRARIIRIAGSGKSYFLSTDRDQRALCRIKMCHRHHVRLIKLAKKLNRILKPVMGLYFSLATLTLCTTAVQLTTDLSKLQLLSLLQYMCATLTQLFLYCRYGDAVVQESDMAKGDGVFASAWWSLSPRIRKELVVLIAGTSCPLKLRAGWFHSLQLPDFMSIVQTAYSYYAVLSKNS